VMEKNFIKDQVTVVIPVYNEERFLRQALESVVEQVDCVILGDNASTDGTEAICREFIEKYNHIIYFRNPENLGSCQNSILCYEKVETEFLFHLGGHDIIPDNYVSSLKKILLERKDAVAAYANVFALELDGSEGRKDCYEKFKDRKNKKFLTDYFEHFSSHQRAAGFFLSPTPFYLYLAYALFHSETVIPLMRQLQPICACDWVLLFEVLLRGKMVHCLETHYIRRNNHPTDTPEEYMKRITLDPVRLKDSETYKMYWPMCEIVLKHFAEYSDDSVSVFKKWNLYWQIEKCMREQYHFYKKIPGIKIPLWYICLHYIHIMAKNYLNLLIRIFRKICRIPSKIRRILLSLFVQK
jgi:glycosyltransferase involved in cell wall biosynthesis